MEGPPVAPPAEALLASHYNSRGTYQTAAVREQYLPVGSARSLENHARPGAGYRKGGDLLRFCVVSGDEDQVRD